MKLAFVEMAGFRGFKGKTRFDLAAGFVVLTGRNGVGKSTVLDAIDFVLTGTINKYEVRAAKGGGLDSHIWWVGGDVPQGNYVTIGLVDEGGQEFLVTRSRERGLELPPESLASLMCLTERPLDWPDTLMRTTLIRDETIAALSLDLPEQARFAAVRAAIGGLAGPDYSERTAALLRAANSAKSDQETLVASAQSELGRMLTALTEARSIADRHTDVAAAQRMVDALLPDLASAAVTRSEILRRGIADRKLAVSILEETLTLAERLQAEQIRLESELGKTEFSAARTRLDDARRDKEQADEALARAQLLQVAEQDTDTFADHLVALLAHGEKIGLQDGHCPLCDAVRSSEDFAAAIASARAKLNTQGARAARVAADLERAGKRARDAGVAMKTAVQHVAELDAQRDGLSREIQKVGAVFGQWGLPPSLSEIERARHLALQQQDDTARLEHALFLLEASSAHDRVTSLEARVDQLRSTIEEETAKLTTAERAVEAARQIDTAAKTVANQVLTEQFDTVMPLLKELYRRLRPHTDWQEIETDFGGRVRASLNFTVGDGQNPQFLFSSGQRRAAGIAFLLAIHLSRPWCRLRSLLLDDPIHHIDDYRALNLVEVLSALRRSGRQVIVAIEDPALADLLCRRLRSTALDIGRRFDLRVSEDGSAAIERTTDIFPLLRETLRAVAS
jgi:DNA repair exonuclease SbcCD ATPase subunit